MDECKGEPIAAAAAAVATGRKDSEVNDANQSAAVAPSAAASVFLSRLLPARSEAVECDICNEPLESSEAASGGGAVNAIRSRLPRLLPCGHSLCTGCIQKGLDSNGGLLKCPQCGGFDPPQRPESAFKLPKNFTAIKLIEAQADRDAMAELSALPCQQCDPAQPRRAAKVRCDDCGVNYCKQHDAQVHCVALLLGHQRISIAAHAAQLDAASAAKKAAVLAAAAVNSRLAAKAEEQNIRTAMLNLKKRQERLPQDLDAIKAEVEGTAKQLYATADRLRSDFEKHRQVPKAGSQMQMHQQTEEQSVVQTTQQLADCAAALVPLCESAQRVQEADDFDANLLFAQLQRNAEQLHARLRLTSADAGQSFDLSEARLLQSVLSLSHVTCQSLILNAELAAKLAAFFKGLELKPQSELLYRGSRDGFTRDDFVRCCANKGPAMTLVKVAGTHFVFGAYTHCSWPSVNGTVADPTGKSFLFSLVNSNGKAMRFSLQDKDRAIQLARSICFGAAKYEGGKTTAYPNFILMHKGAADGKDANCANHSKDHNTPYQSNGGAVCDRSCLAGQEYFAAAEIEVFQI